MTFSVPPVPNGSDHEADLVPHVQSDPRDVSTNVDHSPLLIVSRTVDTEALALARDVVDVASEKGAEDILLMDIRKMSIIADYFVICSSDNERNMRAIARAILDVADENYGADPIHKPSSNAEESGWMLLDFGPVIVHIFSPATREFYRIERLWSEAATLLRMQ